MYIFKATGLRTPRPTVRSPGNPMGASGVILFQGNSGAEGSSGYLIDRIASGIKVRSASGFGFNETSQTTVGIAFAEAPFKYANAR